MKGYSIKSSDWETIYPIGSIYMSTNTTSPATFLGGTWEQIKDKFLLCSGSTYSNGSTGGSASHVHGTQGHVLTINEMPSHRHPIRAESASGNLGYLLCDIKGSTQQYQEGYRDLSYMDYVGGGGSHNHGDTTSTSSLPPYLAVTVWKRTA